MLNVRLLLLLLGFLVGSWLCFSWGSASISGAGSGAESGSCGGAAGISESDINAVTEGVQFWGVGFEMGKRVREMA